MTDAVYLLAALFGALNFLAHMVSSLGWRKEMATNDASARDGAFGGPADAVPVSKRDSSSRSRPRPGAYRRSRAHLAHISLTSCARRLARRGGTGAASSRADWRFRRGDR